MTSPVNPTSNIVSKLALSKVMQGMGGAALKNAGPLASMASNLFYTSPEEVAVLKAAEEKKRASGWKPLNER